MFTKQICSNFSFSFSSRTRHAENQIPSSLKKPGLIHMQMVVKNLFSKLLFLALLTAAYTVVVPAQTVADVDAVVQKVIDAKAIPAAGVVVVRGGKVVLAKG